MRHKPFLKIGKRFIGEKYLPLVIVEIGINHNGKIKLAKDLIKVAHGCGAEIIKHQTHIPDDEMSIEAKKIIPVHTTENIYDIISNSSISYEQEKNFQNYVHKLGMTFLSTPFSREAANRLNKMNVPAYKIGSGECNNYPLIEHICKFKKPIILSTGMNGIKSIRKAVKIIESYKISYALLHCTNLYPTPINLIRLNAIDEIKKMFPKAVVGLSDHTGENYTSFAALGKGASIIEKHFIDNKNRKGPDIAASIDKKQLRDLIIGSREIYKSLPGEVKPVKDEKKTANFAFASIVSNEQIKAGTILTKKNIWVRRPGTGDFKAELYKKLIGKKVYKDIKKNTQLKKNHLKNDKK